GGARRARAPPHRRASHRRAAASRYRRASADTRRPCAPIPPTFPALPPHRSASPWWPPWVRRRPLNDLGKTAAILPPPTGAVYCPLPPRLAIVGSSEHARARITARRP